MSLIRDIFSSFQGQHVVHEQDMHVEVLDGNRRDGGAETSLELRPVHARCHGRLRFSFTPPWARWMMNEVVWHTLRARN